MWRPSPGQETLKRKSAKTNNYALHAVTSKAQALGWPRTKNFLVPALKKSKQDTRVKGSIVGDKLLVNGSNNILMQWRNTQLQGQCVQTQNTEDLNERPNTTEMEPIKKHQRSHRTFSYKPICKLQVISIHGILSLY